MNCPDGQIYDQLFGGCRTCFTYEPCYRNPFSEEEMNSAAKPFKQLGQTALDIVNEQLPNVVNILLGSGRQSSPTSPTSPIISEKDNTTLIAVGVVVAILLLIIIILLFRAIGGR